MHWVQQNLSIEKDEEKSRGVTFGSKDCMVSMKMMNKVCLSFLFTSFMKKNAHVNLADYMAVVIIIIELFFLISANIRKHPKFSRHTQLYSFFGFIALQEKMLFVSETQTKKCFGKKNIVN